MAKPLLRIEEGGFVVVLTFDNAERRNALSRQLLQELAAAVTELHRRDDVRAVIITGAGEQAFCGGADLKERAQLAADAVGPYVDWQRSVIADVAALPMPTIAAINGVAFGGGLELALACDMRLAVADAVLGLTETALGIIPGAGGTYRLPRLVGSAWASEMIFAARRVPAPEAAAIGLVGRVVPRGELMAAAAELAGAIARNAPLAVRLAKKALKGGALLSEAEAEALESECYHRIVPTSDRLEGLAAFFEKRPPAFTGQ